MSVRSADLPTANLLMMRSARLPRRMNSMSSAMVNFVISPSSSMISSIWTAYDAVSCRSGCESVAGS